MDSYPKIRDIHPIPYEKDGQPAFLLRDPLQLNGHMLVIPQAIAPLIYIADGTRDISVLSAILDYHYGLKISEKEVSDILAIFDDAYLLENDRAKAAHDEALNAYRETGYRTPTSAGSSYPSEPVELKELLDGYLEQVEAAPDTIAVRGILSPHIDFQRGGNTYAEVWKRASLSILEAELIVILATDHYSDRNEITLTRQNYATPYGVMPTDQGVVDQLAEALGEENAFSGELFHRTEHSIELPLIWLHHILGDKQIPLVPILIGNIGSDKNTINRFINTLRDATRDRKTFIVISGDLAHIGPAFGGERVDSNARHNIEIVDRKLMDLLSKGDSKGFLAEIEGIENANNVCGTYPLYTALEAFNLGEGEINGYQQCPADDEDTSIVSVGGIVFR